MPTAVPYANFGNPQSLNLYSYVKDNPTTWVDLDGHGCEKTPDENGTIHCLVAERRGPETRTEAMSNDFRDFWIRTQNALHFWGVVLGSAKTASFKEAADAEPMRPALALGGGFGGELLGFSEIAEMDPALIRFSQSSISPNFSDGGNVEELANALRNGTVKPDSIPPIRVVEKDGQLFTLDNRRLAAFQKAGVWIRYQMATAEEAAREAWKFTTKNGGISIRIRGPK